MVVTYVTPIWKKRPARALLTNKLPHYLVHTIGTRVTCMSVREKTEPSTLNILRFVGRYVPKYNVNHCHLVVVIAACCNQVWLGKVVETPSKTSN